MIITLFDFLRTLPADAFYAQDAEDQPFYDVEAVLEVIDWAEPGPGMLRQVSVVWNADSTVATVTGVNDEYHRIFKAKALIFAA